MSKLPESVAKEGLLHPELVVRRQCFDYFMESWSSDPEVVPRIFDAMDRYGRDEAFGKFFPYLANFPLAEEGLLRCLADLENNPESDALRAAGRNMLTGRCIGIADLSILRRHYDRIMKAVECCPGVTELIADRMTLSTMATDELWQEVAKTCRLVNGDDEIDRVSYLQHLDCVAERLAILGESAERVMEILTQPPTDLSVFENCVPLYVAIDVAGRLGLEQAIDPIVDQLIAGQELEINEVSADALRQIGSEAVGDALLRVLPTIDDDFRIEAANVMTSLKRTGTAAKLLAMLPAVTDDADVRGLLLQAALSHLETDAIEPARLHFSEHPDGDVDWLLALAILSGTSFPEFDDWLRVKQQDLAYMDEIDLTQTFNSLEDRAEASGRMGPKLDSARDEQPVKPLRSDPKIGRNAPCPCGSGKKYKKCCLGDED